MIDIPILKNMGYCVLQVSLGKWRVKGAEGYIDVHFAAQKYHWHGKVLDYNAIVPIITKYLKPYYLTPSDAFYEWRASVEGIYVAAECILL